MARAYRITGRGARIGWVISVGYACDLRGISVGHAAVRFW